MADTKEPRTEGQQDEEKSVDFLVDSVSDEDLEDASGGCTGCANGCSHE